ncbi:MAG: hypothetical protein SFV32_09250 [Opitutaceae bacterium]|nr:hypothetical protein [Opitutaceae bacterium]
MMRGRDVWRFLGITLLSLSLCCGSPRLKAETRFSFEALPQGSEGKASFSAPVAIVRDSKGNFFVADNASGTIRKMTADGVVSTFAGMPEWYGVRDGPGDQAVFAAIHQLGIDSNDTLYVLETRPGDFSSTTYIRKVSPAGIVSTFIGAGCEWGVASATGYWWSSTAMAVARDGTIYLADGNRDQISKVSADGSVSAFYSGPKSGTFGPGALGIDSKGNLYAANWAPTRLLRISPDGTAKSALAPADPTGLYPGPAGGVQIDTINAITSDPAGNLYLTDHTFGRITRVTPDGLAEIIAGGNGNTYPSDGKGREALFGLTGGITIDTGGNLFVTDWSSIRKVTPDGSVSIFAGLANKGGHRDGVGGAFELYTPVAIAVNANGDVFAAEWFNQVIRKISREGVISVLAGHIGRMGSIDGIGSAARFEGITALAMGPDSHLYAAQLRCIRRISQSDDVVTLAGDSEKDGAVDGPAKEARFGYISGIAVGADGTVYVSDKNNFAVRKLTRDGKVTTLAGKIGDRDFRDGKGSEARFFAPSHLTLGKDGHLYVDDLLTIRRITLSGEVVTVGGKRAAHLSRSGPPDVASMSEVNGLTVDSQGNILFSDFERVRVMKPDGTIEFVAGSAEDPSDAYFFGPNIGEGLDDRFTLPHGITTDAKGRLYVSDYLGCVWRGRNEQTERPSPLVNISCRALVGQGENVSIGGFVVRGTTSKRFLIRAVGPTLKAYGLSASEVLADPELELYSADQANVLIGANDNWQDAPNVGDITSASAKCGAGALSADDTRSSVILTSLKPGAYTFVTRGKAAAGGIALLEVFDVDTQEETSSLINIAARARASSGAGVTIGGFAVNGPLPKVILVRAVGPTLSRYGIPKNAVLSDPTIEVHDQRSGQVIAVNDDWKDAGNATEIRDASLRIGAASFAEDDERSSAMLLTVPPGLYSFVAKGKDNASGIVLVEVFDAD